MRNEEPLGRVVVKPLFDEWWWECRRSNGILFDFGWDTDRKRANEAAREAGRRLSEELGQS